MRIVVSVFTVLLILFMASFVYASDFVDTWITFIFADDNVLAGPRDRSPEAGFQTVDDEMFFENLEQEKRGQETQTQLVLYKRSPSFFKNMDVEAALVIEMENWTNSETGESTTQIADNGSYLKLNYFFSKKGDSGDHLSITAFPLDSQRFLLGYAYDIAWGGEKIFPRNTGQVPGVRLMGQWSTGTDWEGYVFTGAKTVRLLNEEIHELQTYYGILGGFGQSITNWVMIEANGGFFQRGAFPPQGEDSNIGGLTVEAYGASTRLTVHKGLPVGHSVDFRLYKNDPEVARQMTSPAKYDSGVSFSMSGEYTYLTQTLLDWDDSETTVLQPAMASNVNAKVQINKLRLHGDFIYRDLSFILFNVPGIAPYRAFPENTEMRSEWFVAGGIDYYFEGPHLTPGMIVGYRQPATFNSGAVVTVFRDEDDWETLPDGKNAFDIISAKLTLKWDVAEILSIIGELRYTLDNNRTKYEQSEGESGRKRIFDDPDVTNQLGFGLMMQARF